MLVLAGCRSYGDQVEISVWALPCDARILDWFIDLRRRQQPGHGDGRTGRVPHKIAYVPACRILGLVVLMFRGDLAGCRGERRFTMLMGSQVIRNPANARRSSAVGYICAGQARCDSGL
jgi:hypothetical protein